jgi:hypothetical protein
MLHTIALGGNKRNFPGWDNIYSSGNTAGDIKYAGHLMVRHRVPLLHVDFSRNDWQSWLHMESPTGTILAADTDALDVVFLNKGSFINRIVVEHKMALAGVTASAQVYDNTGATVGPAMAIDFSTAGYTHLAIGQMMQKGGTLRITPVLGDLATACFTAMVDLTTFSTDYECGCAPAPCNVVTPDPLCFVPVVSA